MIGIERLHYSGGGARQRHVYNNPAIPTCSRKADKSTKPKRFEQTNLRPDQELENEIGDGQYKVKPTFWTRRRLVHFSKVIILQLMPLLY